MSNCYSHEDSVISSSHQQRITNGPQVVYITTQPRTRRQDQKPQRSPASNPNSSEHPRGCVQRHRPEPAGPNHWNLKGVVKTSFPTLALWLFSLLALSFFLNILRVFCFFCNPMVLHLRVTHGLTKFISLPSSHSAGRRRRTSYPVYSQ